MLSVIPEWVGTDRNIEVPAWADWSQTSVQRSLSEGTQKEEYAEVQIGIDSRKKTGEKVEYEFDPG